VRVLEGLVAYEPRGDARWIDWVAKLAQHEIQNHARRERTQKRGGGLAKEIRIHAESAAEWDIPADTTGVHSKVARKETTSMIDRFVNELSDAQREVMLLRAYAGGDWTSVAELMGRSIGACQELHRRARMALAERLRTKI
jgi:RNA polymerase sigma factor (sigma-70 family)